MRNQKENKNAKNDNRFYNSPLYLSLLDRFKGYAPKFPRQFILLLRIFSPREFLLYLTLTYVITDWDTRHKIYGFFNYNPFYLSKVIQCSEITINRAFKSLEKKGFVKCFDKRQSLYALIGYEFIDAVFSHKKENNIKIKPFEYLRLLLCAVLRNTNFDFDQQRAKLTAAFSDLRLEPLEELDIPMDNRSKSKCYLSSYNGNLVYRRTNVSDIDIDEILRQIEPEKSSDV